MRILILSKRDRSLRLTSQGMFWKPAFERKGLEVDFYNFDKFLPASISLCNQLSNSYVPARFYRLFYRRAEKNLLCFLSRKKYDLVMFCGGKNIQQETLKKAKKIQKDAVFFNVFNDNPFFYFNFFKTIPFFDNVFLKDTYILEELKKVGYENCFYLPQAFSSEYHTKYDSDDISIKEKEHLKSDLSFIGSIYPQRQKIFENLKGYDLKIWGKSIWKSVDKNSWVIKKHTYEMACLNKKSKVIACSKINLNTHHYQNDINGTSSRTFEICGCGGFQLVDYKPILERHFKMGKEIETFSSIKEMKNKIDYYLNNPEERKKIASAGYKRAIRDHSYSKRVAEILRICRGSR